MDDTIDTIKRNITEIYTKQGRTLSDPITEKTDLTQNLQFSEAQEMELLCKLEKEFDIHFTLHRLPRTVREIDASIRVFLAEKKRKANRILTIPNILSLFRLLLIPVYVIIYINAKVTSDYLLAGGILAISCITDLFDGMIARRFDQISNLGKVLDPFADKATQGVMLLCIAKHHPVLWWLFGFFGLKEGFQLVIGCWYLKKGQMRPGALMPGKISTTVLFFCMILLVIFPNLPGWTVFLLIGLCALFLAISFVAYIKAYFGKNKKVETL